MPHVISHIRLHGPILIAYGSQILYFLQNLDINFFFLILSEYCNCSTHGTAICLNPPMRNFTEDRRNFTDPQQTTTF